VTEVGERRDEAVTIRMHRRLPPPDRLRTALRTRHRLDHLHTRRRTPRHWWLRPHRITRWRRLYSVMADTAIIRRVNKLSVSRGEGYSYDNDKRHKRRRRQPVSTASWINRNSNEARYDVRRPKKTGGEIVVTFLAREYSH
jgi:hypothetical protein